jgi:methyltransferase
VSARAAYLVLLGLFAAERLAELVISTSNARGALRRGAVEQGRGHYPVMVGFHAGFLVVCALVAVSEPHPPPLALLAALGALLAQALRWWAIATLGRRWNTRILVLPGESPVTGGPYRWVRHPNYLAVILEMALLPLAWGAWRTAIAFSLGNALLLAVRIPAEERALGEAWARSFHGKGRFVPGLSLSPAPGRPEGSGDGHDP